MWTDNLRQFHFWCQKTLPLVYDDSLSYYEVLAKVTKHLNELTTLVNEIGDELERYEGVTDNRLDALELWRTEVDTWRAQIDEWKGIVENWREDVDLWRQDVELWQTSINNWKDAVDLELASLDDRLDTAESDIDSLEGRMDTAEGDIDSLEGRMDTAEDDIDTLQSDVTSLDGRLDDAESAITGLDDRLDTAESDIDSLEGRMDTAEDDIDTLQSDATSLDGRLDDAESDIEDIQDDVTDLQNRMGTAETNIVNIQKAIRIIPIHVSFDSTDNIYKAFCANVGDDEFIKNNLTAARIDGSTFGAKVRFLMHFNSPTPFDFTNNNVYLFDDNGISIKYNNTDAYIKITKASGGIIENDITSNYEYLLDTLWTGVIYCSLPGGNAGLLPAPSASDNGKVVSYNYPNKKYELITPPTPSTGNDYSETEHEVGTWLDGSTKVYEKVFHIYDSFTSSNRRTVSVPGAVIDYSYMAIQDGSGGITYNTTTDSVVPVKIEIEGDTESVGSTIAVRIGVSSTTMYSVVIIARYVKKNLSQMRITT